MGDASNGAQAPAAAAQGTEGATPVSATGAAGQAQGQTPSAANGNQGENPIKAAAQEAIRKHKLKVDGQEIEVDDEELKRGYTHQKAANKKLQEGVKLRKQSEEFITAMRDPGKLVDTLQKMGWEPKQIREVAERYLAGVLEDEMLDPKDKELKTTKQRLQEFEKKEQDRKDAEEARHQGELKKKYAEQYSADFIEALKTTGLPPTKDMVGAMAGYISRAAKIKMPMTASEAAKLVREDVEVRNKHLFSNLSPDQIIKIVGEDGLKKLREYDVSRIKDPNANIKTPGEQGEVTRKKDPGVKRMTTAEWRAFNRGK